MLFLGLAGCDALFRLAEVPRDGASAVTDGTGGGRDADVAGDARNACVTDGFDGTTPDLDAEWERIVDTGCTPSIAGGELQIQVAPNQNCYGGVRRRSSVDFNGAVARVHVTKTLDGELVDTQFGMLLDLQNMYLMNRDHENMAMRVVVDNQHLEIATVLYDSSRDVHWQIEHVPAGPSGAAVVFSTSPDGTTWTELHRVTARIPVGMLSARLFGGSYGFNVGITRNARFDDFTLCIP